MPETGEEDPEKDPDEDPDQIEDQDDDEERSKAVFAALGCPDTSERAGLAIIDALSASDRARAPMPVEQVLEALNKLSCRFPRSALLCARRLEVELGRIDNHAIGELLGQRLLAAPLNRPARCRNRIGERLARAAGTGRQGRQLEPGMGCERDEKLLARDSGSPDEGYAPAAIFTHCHTPVG